MIAAMFFAALAFATGGIASPTQAEANTATVHATPAIGTGAHVGAQTQAGAQLQAGAHTQAGANAKFLPWGGYPYAAYPYGGYPYGSPYGAYPYGPVVV